MQDDTLQESIEAAAGRLPNPEGFLDAMEDAATTDSDVDAPLVPFKSAYQLTRDQENRLLEHAKKRLQNLEDELGRTVTSGDWYQQAEHSGDIGDNPERTFFGKRYLYEMVYHNKVEWRKWIKGGIFQVSNLVVPIVRRVVRQMIARAINYFFGTDPWMAAFPVGEGDRETADKVEKYAKVKFLEADVLSVKESAVVSAFVRGEGIIKTVYVTRDDIYSEMATFLQDGEGNPILDSSGDYILQSDRWVESVGSDDEPFVHLKKDHKTVLAETLEDGLVVMRDEVEYAGQWASDIVKRRIVQYQGPEESLVYYRDFLCPLNAEDVQSADCIVHLMDMPVAQLVDQYRRQGLMGEDPQTGEEDIEQTAAAIRLLRTLSEQGDEYSTAQHEPRVELDEGEGAQNSQITAPGTMAEIAEFWLRYDANGDGILENIMLVMDRKSGLPIYYDFAANMTPDGQRPFDVVRVNKVEKRWHGLGAMEMYETLQDIIDLMINRWNRSMGESGRVTTVQWDAVVEGERMRDLKMNAGGTFTLVSGKTIEDFIQTKELYSVEYKMVREMMEFFMQVLMNESGVANTNDAQTAGLDSSELATGIRNMENSGQEMFSLFLTDLKRGLGSAAKRALMVLLANIQERETFSIFEGDNQILMEIDANSVSDMEFDIELLMTRFRNEQLLQSNSAAVDLVERFYSLLPQIQEVVAPLYRNQLKAMHIPNPDELVVPMPIQAPPAGASGAPPADAAAPLAPGKSEVLL